MLDIFCTTPTVRRFTHVEIRAPRHCTLGVTLALDHISTKEAMSTKNDTYAPVSLWDSMLRALHFGPLASGQESF
jgi:hypothetical protein